MVEIQIKFFRFLGKVALFILLCAAGCGQAPDAENAGAEVGYIADAKMDVSAEESVALTDRKLIRNAQLEFETANLPTARATILSAVSAHKGFVANDRSFNNPGRLSSTITVRVPAAQFEPFITAIDALAQAYDSKEISADDVTAEFVDIEARLSTKKALEARYAELLTSTKTITDILEIERQMAQLRGEIESIEGRLKLLQNQVTLSTVNITVYQTLSTSTAFGEKIGNGWRNGWENLMWFFVELINLWPFILLTLLLLGYFAYRKRKRSMKP